MDVAAGIVGFIGLTGQILQGCNYISTLLSDIKDGPEIACTLRKELHAVESSLAHFKALLSELDAHPHLIPHGWNPNPALELCESAVHRLRKFVGGFPELHQDNTSVAGGWSAQKKQIGWQRLKFARNQVKLQKHVERLQSAREELELLQSNIGSRIGLASYKLFDEKLKHMSQSARALSIEGSRASKDSATIVESVQRLEIQSGSNRTELSEFKTELSQQFDNLPSALSGMMEMAVMKALNQHTSRPRIKPLSYTETAVGTESALSTATHHNGIERDSRDNHDLTFLQSEQRVSPATADLFAPKAQLVRKSPKRQKSNKSSYSTWFGRIVITTTTTEQEDMSLADQGKKFPISASRTMITLIPSLWFSTRGAMFQMGSVRPSNTHPSWDNRLRVFRTHPEGSALNKVLLDGDYVEFRNMLQRGEATPFDQVFSVDRANCFLNPYVSLFEHIVAILREQCPVEIEGHIKVARLIADCGVDCGLGESMLLIQSLALQKLQRSTAYDLYYLAMSRSETNPFDTVFKIVTLFQIRSFLTQDEWDLSELQENFEKRNGKRSWEALVIQKVERNKWEVSQKQEWSQKADELRWSKTYCEDEFGRSFVEYTWPNCCLEERGFSLFASKEDCADLFGEYFMEHTWPKLYWKHEIPPFWHSREKCAEIFGDHFVEYEWPQLYWEREVPSFWRSKERCMEVFGEEFVRYQWPSFYWRQEIPTFWHVPSECEETFGESFMRWQWPQILGESCFEYVSGWGAWEVLHNRMWSHEKQRLWLSHQLQQWRSQNSALRHSRSHNFSEFGIKFVTEQLPALLKADGLKQDQIEALTKDGSDIYCRPPQYPRRNWEKSWDDEEIEDEVSDGGSNDFLHSEGDGSGTSNGLDSDNSGWETADEELDDGQA